MPTTAPTLRSRRLALIGLALLAASALGLSRSFASLADAPVPNPIQIENSLPGEPGWNDFASVLDPTAISGYGSAISVNHGGSIDFYVTTTDPQVTIEIYRVGWYGGAGARLVTSLGTFPGVNQPQAAPDPVFGTVAEGWSKTASLNVPAGWTTGVYLARLTASSSGNRSFIFFVVRDDEGTEPYVFQTSVNTYQAYNSYGGTSLYENLTDQSTYAAPHAMKVSFDRPFNPGDSNGAGHFLWWEYPMLRWLERQGYNVTYTTNADIDSGVNPLRRHKALLSVGHDEYWTKGMRDNVEGAIAAGVNVAFFAGNESYWQVRYENNAAGVPQRLMVGYKDFASCACPPGPDPMWNVNNSVVTDLWRSDTVGRPEDGMMGVMFGGETVNSDWIVQNSSHWIYAGTGWTDGTHVPGLVGYEYDHFFGDSTTPPGTVVLSNTPLVNTENGQDDTANAVFYTAPSGARVFAASTIQWAYGLDDYGGTPFVNAGIQRMTANILANFGA